MIDKFLDQEYSLLGTRNIGTGIAKLANNGNPMLSRGLANNGYSYLSRGASQLLVILQRKKTIVMPKKSVEIEGKEIDLFYLVEAGDYEVAKELWYPQLERSLSEFNKDNLHFIKIKSQYYSKLLSNCQKIAAEIDKEYKAIVACPSNKPFARELKSLLINYFREMEDITYHFKKDSKISSGKNQTSEEDVYNSISIDRDIDADQIRSVLIVDDVYGEGKTIRSVVKRLRENGLKESGKIAVVCPLIAVPGLKN